MNHVRSLQEKDIDFLLDLFCNTINTINKSDYSPEQISVWGSRSRVERNWKKSFENKYVYVYEHRNIIKGFSELRDDGYIDRFYIDSQFIGCGVGRSLYEQLESKAYSLNIIKLFVDSSITAEPFFINMEFVQKDSSLKKLFSCVHLTLSPP